MDPNQWLGREQAQRVTEAIKKSEQLSSAEIKLVVARHCWGDIHVKARKLFLKYRLDQTKLRNAVLILVIVSDRQFLIHGDEGIDKKVGPDFWAGVRDDMAGRFKAGHKEEALCQGIKQIGRKLAEFFPRGPGDVNELSDAPTIES